MALKISDFLTTLYQSSSGYSDLPFFVKKLFKNAGNDALWNQDASAAYKIASGERTVSSNQASGIDLNANLHRVIRYLTKEIPEDSTLSLLTRFGVPACGGTNRTALMFALAHQFFRCIYAAGNEADNIIPDFYRRACDHPSIMTDPEDSGTLALFANEVGGFCPLCAPPKKFTYKRDGSPSNFTTIQIFPSGLDNETKEAFARELGDEPESYDAFENRIAVCRDCADAHCSPLFGPDLEEAKRLKAIKESFMKRRKAQQDANDSELGAKINDILDAIRTKKVFEVPEDEEVDLTYDPHLVARKITTDDDLCDKVTRMAVKHYDNIRRHFYYLDKTQEGTFDDICDQVKRVYRIFSRSYGHKSQEEIFNALVAWLNQKTYNSEAYVTACEIVISFFVQDCEVFVAS